MRAFLFHLASILLCIQITAQTPETVLVPGGTFEMGCTPDQFFCNVNEENLLHTVELSNYYIGKYETTQNEWMALMGTNPSTFPNCGSDCPVETVSWYDAITFCNRLSVQDGFTPC